MWRHFRAAAEMGKKWGNLSRSIPKLRPGERVPLIGIASAALISGAISAPGIRCARCRDFRPLRVSAGLRRAAHIYRMVSGKSIGVWRRFYLGRLDVYERTSHGVSATPTRLLL